MEPEQTLADKHGIPVLHVSDYGAYPDGHKDAMRIVTAIQTDTLHLTTDPVQALEQARKLFSYIQDLNAAAGDYKALGNFQNSVLDDPHCAPVRERFLHWVSFMEDNVCFTQGGNGIHGMSHCARVLLLALAMGHKLGLEDGDLETLAAAAVFHDSRRTNDLHDPDHGTNSASYYQAYCKEYSFKYDNRVFTIIAYHDHDDALGLEACAALGNNCTLLYKLFKDADGLDRIRLNRDYLNTSMLRTAIAPSYLPLAERILAETRQ